MTEAMGRSPLATILIVIGGLCGCLCKELTSAGGAAGALQPPSGSGRYLSSRRGSERR